jgi:hypothetical protein
MKTKNLLFLFLIAFILLGAYVYFFVYNKSHVDTFTAKADYEIEAFELFRYFEEDEAKANEKFLGNILKVEGIVLDVEYSEGEVAVIRLDVGEILDAVVCEPDPIYKREMPALNRGDRVVIQGVCTGFLNDVIINRCVVLEIKK